MGKGNGSTREVEERELPVRLTEAELLKRGDDMAACVLAIEALKLERTQVNQHIREQLVAHDTLAHTIDRGEEDRQVRCAWIEDYAKNVWRLKRQDTGAEVDTRPMTAADRTGKLFDVDTGAELGVPPPRTPRKRASAKKNGRALRAAPSALAPDATA